MINTLTLINQLTGKVIEIPNNFPVTYVSATTILIKGDWTASIVPGSFISLTNGTAINGITRTVSLSGSDTQILGYWDTALTNTTITDVRISRNIVPVGHPTYIEYSPTWSSTGTAPVIGNGTLSGLYVPYGDLVYVDITLVAGSTTTFGTGTYSFSLPRNMRNVAAGAVFNTLSGFVGDTGTGSAFIVGRIADNGNSVLLLRTGTGTTLDAGVTATNPITLVNTDTISLNGWYTAP